MHGGGVNESPNGSSLVTDGDGPNGSDGVNLSIWLRPCCKLFNSSSKSMRSAMTVAVCVLFLIFLAASSRTAGLDLTIDSRESLIPFKNK